MSVAAASPAKSTTAESSSTTQHPTKERTFQYDDSLPLLPLPSLQDTFGRLRPFCAAAAPSPEAAAPQLAEYDALVAKAMPQLEAAQKILEERHRTQNNYVGDWWTEFAYLRNRFPNVLNTNVFCVRDSEFDALGEPNPLTHDPAVRCALTIQESMLMRRLVRLQELPVERAPNKAPMSMDQYRRYWTTRVPGIDCDAIYAADVNKATQAAVMYRGAFFFIDAIHPETQEELNVAELTETLRLGFSKVRPLPPDECVGTLTATDRDSWATAWKELESQSKNNRDILSKILNAMCLVCVDDVPVASLKEGINRASHEQPHNRWYDRSSVRIVSSNGISLEHGDHTAMDAIVMASTPVEIMASFSRKFVQSGKLRSTTPRPGFDPAKLLHLSSWDLTPTLRLAIKDALAQHQANLQGIEVDCYAFRGFGRDALRAGKVNADAFVQQALQLAFFRDRGLVVPVYETASTRLFREGRTDTIRSLTTEQRRFVETFDDKSVEPVEKARRLFRALFRHTANTALSSTGRGVDRHLMALRVAQQAVVGKELPDVFGHPLVVESGAYQLLTSQMIGRQFVGGFAHVLDDGYGCCYYLRRNAICIVVSGCSKAGNTNLERFQKNITAAFSDLARLLQSEAGLQAAEEAREAFAKKSSAAKTAPTRPASRL